MSNVVRWSIAVSVGGAAFLVFGTVFHHIPAIGLSAGIVGAVPLWFVILPLVGAGSAWAAWRKWPARFGTTVVVTGVVTALAGGFITGRMIYAVQDAGVKINGVQLLRVAPLNRGEPDDRPVYLKRDGEPLRIDLYRPEPTTTLAPVLVYVHGGGWTKGSPADRSSDMRWFADQGFLVLSVEYSLSASTQHLWDVAQGQIGCSLSWAATHASEYGGDVSRLSLSGDSAGGNLAINAAYLQAADQLPSACGGQAPVVGAVSVAYPGVDLESIYNSAPDAAAYVHAYVGGTPQKYPERYAAVSSVNKIIKDAPPTLIMAGNADHLVPPQSIDRFVLAARDAGIDTKLVMVPFAEHGFDILSGSIGNQAFRQLTLNWLSEHGQAP